MYLHRENGCVEISYDQPAVYFLQPSEKSNMLLSGNLSVSWRSRILNPCAPDVKVFAKTVFVAVSFTLRVDVNHNGSQRHIGIKSRALCGSMKCCGT